MKHNNLSFPPLPNNYRGRGADAIGLFYKCYLTFEKRREIGGARYGGSYLFAHLEGVSFLFLSKMGNVCGPADFVSQQLPSAFGSTGKD